MCNYSDGVERRALARGEANGRKLEKIASIDRFIEKHSMSLDDACDLMEMSAEEYLATKETAD